VYERDYGDGERTFKKFKLAQSALDSKDSGFNFSGSVVEKASIRVFDVSHYIRLQVSTIHSEILRKEARYGLLWVVAVSGFVIALRMLVGPFDAPVRVRVPLNPEGWFGVALTLLLAIRPKRKSCN
jgi:hypothetical protein